MLSIRTNNNQSTKICEKNARFYIASVTVVAILCPILYLLSLPLLLRALLLHYMYLKGVQHLCPNSKCSKPYFSKSTQPIKLEIFLQTLSSIMKVLEHFLFEISLKKNFAGENLCVLFFKSCKLEFIFLIKIQKNISKERKEDDFDKWQISGKFS